MRMGKGAGNENRLLVGIGISVRERVWHNQWAREQRTQTHVWRRCWNRQRGGDEKDRIIAVVG